MGKINKNHIMKTPHSKTRKARWTAIAILCLAAMLNNLTAQAGANGRPAMEKSIKTVYPTKDWVISDYVVTDPEFGARAEPGFDNRSAFQSAIDAA